MGKKQRSYLQILDAQLAIWDAQLRKLQARARQGTAIAVLKQEAYRRRIRKRLRSLRHTLNEMRVASEANWEKLKRTVDQFFAQLEPLLAEPRRVKGRLGRRRAAGLLPAAAPATPRRRRGRAPTQRSRAAAPAPAPSSGTV